MIYDLCIAVTNFWENASKWVNKIFILAKSFRGLCSSSWGGYVARAQLHLIMQETQSLYPSLLPFLPIYFPSLCSFCEMVLSTFMKGLLLVNGVWKLSLNPQTYALLISLELLSLINLKIKNYHILSLIFCAHQMDFAWEIASLFLFA